MVKQHSLSISTVWIFKGEGRDTSLDIYAIPSVRLSRKTFFFWRQDKSENEKEIRLANI